MPRLICTLCGIQFSTSNPIRNKKKITCKFCRQIKKNALSTILLYMLLQKLLSYEQGLFEMIKLFEIPVFHSELFYNITTSISPIMFNISKFYYLDHELHFRYSKRFLTYLRKNKDRLKRRYSQLNERDEVILSINYELIPLCYLPYIYIDSTSGEQQSYEDKEYDCSYYEMIIIDYNAYQLDLSKKIMREQLNLTFNTKTGSYQQLTYSSY